MNTIIKKLFPLCIIYCISSGILKAQNVAINTSGNAAYTGAILDLSNNNLATGTVGFLPPYVTLTSATVLAPVAGTATQLSGLLVYNTSASTSLGLSGPGLYYWNNALATPSWVYLGAATVNANNGLSIGTGTSAGYVELGGVTTTPAPLLHTSVISGSGFTLDYDLGTYTATGTGSFLVTNGGVATPLLSVTSTTPGVGINVNPAVSTLDDNGSFGTGISPVITATSLVSTAYSTYLVNPSGGSFFLLVPGPAATNNRRIYTIVFDPTAATNNTVTVESSGAYFMAGNNTPASSFVMNGGSVTIQSNGTYWYIISGNIFDVPFSSGGAYFVDNTVSNTNYYTGSANGFMSLWNGYMPNVQIGSLSLQTACTLYMTQVAENTGTLASPTFTPENTYNSFTLASTFPQSYYQYTATGTCRLVSVNLYISNFETSTFDFEIWKYPASSINGGSYTGPLSGGVEVAGNTSLSVTASTENNYVIPAIASVMVNPGDVFVVWVRCTSGYSGIGQWNGSMQFQSLQ
jgi:hypothetical protein